MSHKPLFLTMSTLIFPLLLSCGLDEARIGVPKILRESALLAHSSAILSKNIKVFKHQNNLAILKLRKGQAFEIGANIILLLQEVEDSRCPRGHGEENPNCIWEGEVNAHFSLSYEGREESFSLNFHNEVSTVISLADFEFRILAVEPYPIVDRVQDKEVIISIENTAR